MCYYIMHLMFSFFLYNEMYIATYSLFYQTECIYLKQLFSTKIIFIIRILSSEKNYKIQHKISNVHILLTLT